MNTMYFNKKTVFPWHYVSSFLYNNLHLQGQGAISKDQFYRIINIFVIEII